MPSTNEKCRFGLKPRLERRAVLTGSAFLIAGLGSGTAVMGQSDEAPIQQPASPGDEAFMTRAFEMRQAAMDKGDQAYGAVIVRDGVIVAQSWSRVILDQDPTAHAEMAAIRDAARRLGTRRLGGTVMFSSSRACPMCEAAAFWAGIGQMIHGSGLTRAGAPQLCG